MDIGVCEACNIHRAVGTASMPFVPISFAYCLPCIAADNHPYWILVCNTAMVGGLENSNLDWRNRIETALAYQGRNLDQFQLDVEKDIYLMEKDIANEQD